jgi:DNA-binding beta-propeller fold protein YncE/tRNA A-37 threonylcarbamoyl transferase component Bud32
VSDETPAPREPGIGEFLAGYRLDEIIGRGGMAIVYRAHDERLGRSVALKVLTPRLAIDEAFRRRFIRESRIAASLDHPNIVPIFEAGEASGLLFIAMRFVQGRDVLTIIQQQGPLPPARAAHIVAQVAAALDAAHERGLVHRDVKPGNMLRDAAAGEDQPDHVYLSDFGLSKHWSSASSLTSSGEFLGTMDYVAPEQIEGNPVDGRTDQYALACSAFEMLSGAPPFRRDETMAIMWAQVSAAPPALTSRRPELPAAVDPVIAKALAKAPDDRYATCRQFAAALRSACLSGAGSPAAEAFPGPGSVAGADAAGRVVATGPSSVPAGPGPVPGGPGFVPGGPGSVPGGLASVPGGPGFVPGGPGSVPGGPGFVPGGPGSVPGGPAVTGPPVPPAAQPPRSRRSRAAIVAGCVVLLAAIGGGYALFAGGPGTKAGTKAGTRAGAGLAAPGCTTKTAAASTLAAVHGRLVTIGGKPSAAVVTSRGYGFVALSAAVGVLRTSGTVPALAWAVPVRAPAGLAVTHDGRYLLVAGQSGLSVFRVSGLEHGPAAPLGTLAVPAGGTAGQVTVSPDDKFAFVTIRSGQSGGQVAVFNLRRALTSGFDPADRVALIRVTAQPAGITVAPDGLYAYVTSGPAPARGPGWLTVISMLAEPNTPAFSVLKTVRAGCGPGQVVVSRDSQDVWLTVGGGNAVVAYSAAKLLTDPRHALVARTAVGGRPAGLVFYDHGLRILVADSGPGPGAAVIDVPEALAARPALLGNVSSGAAPAAVTLYPGGKTLLITDAGSGQVQVISVARLP